MANKWQAQLKSVVSFFPPRIVPNPQVADGGEGLEKNPFFKPPLERRFAYPEFLSADLGTEALKKLLAQTKIDPGSIDLILYSCAISDYINIGIGPDIQNRSGAKNATTLQVDSGCASFISMMNVARAFIETGIYQRIAIVTATNFISRLVDFQQSPKSFVLGDGAAAALVERGESSILSCVEHAYGQHYGLMTCKPRKIDGVAKPYWETGSGSLEIEFSFRMLRQLHDNAVNLVSDGILEAIDKSKIKKDDVSYLITHQPNLALMNEWRESVGIRAPRVHDTFEKYGNLFQSSLPVSLADGISTGKIKPGDTIAFGSFSNGGDFVAAMVLRWM